MKHPAWLIGTFLPLLAATTLAADQPEATHARTDDALATKQAMVRDQIQRLMDRMYRLSEALAESEPDSAEKLRAALTEAKERLAQLDAEKAVKLLQEHDLQQARAVQETLLQTLGDVLNVMLAGPDESKRRHGEIDRLGAFREDVDRLIERQRRHVEGTRRAIDGESRAAAIARAIEDVRGMLEAQQSLSRRTAAATDEGDSSLADEQQDLAEQAARSAQQLGAQAEASAGESTQRAHESLESAGERMSDAAKQLAAGERTTAAEHQQAAEEALTRALHELQKEEQQLETGPGSEDGAHAQRETQEQTADLARRMRGEQGAQGGNEQPGGQQGGGQPAAPASDRVEQAQREMGRAADKLDKGELPEAEQKQEEALDELEQARRELDETLEQLRRQEQLDTLASLQERLQTIVNRQKEVNGQTQDLHGKPRESWERADDLALAEVVGRQEANADETNQVLFLLTEDATTVAFPHVIKQVLDDMQLVIERLRKRLLGVTTQQVQGDIVEALEGLLAAIEQKQQELQAGEPGAGLASGPALLPTSAEFKLLKQSQLRINRRTALLNEQRDANGGDDATLLEETKRLAERQKELAELAGEMHAKMAGE